MSSHSNLNTFHFPFTH